MNNLCTETISEVAYHVKETSFTLSTTAVLLTLYVVCVFSSSPLFIQNPVIEFLAKMLNILKKTVIKVIKSHLQTVAYRTFHSQSNEKILCKCIDDSIKSVGQG